MRLHGKPITVEYILCACGCETMIRSFDIYSNRPRKYVNHHGSKGKPKSEAMKIKMSLKRKGKKLSPEHRQKIKEGLAKSTKRIGRPKSV